MRFHATWFKTKKIESFTSHLKRSIQNIVNSFWTPFENRMAEWQNDRKTGWQDDRMTRSHDHMITGLFSKHLSMFQTINWWTFWQVTNQELMNFLHAECSSDADKLMNILHGECSSVRVLCNPTDAIASKYTTRFTKPSHKRAFYPLWQEYEKRIFLHFFLLLKLIIFPSFTLIIFV